MGVLLARDERVVYENKIAVLNDRIESLVEELESMQVAFGELKDEYDMLVQQNMGYQQERKLLLNMIDDKAKELESRENSKDKQLAFSRQLLNKYKKDVENLELQVNMLIGHCKPV